VTARVGVPAPVLYGGIAAIIGLLVAVGFLAGRASGERVATEAAGTLPAAAPPAPAAAPPVPTVEGAQAIPPPPAEVAARPTPAGAGATAAAPGLRREVAEYFREMDATQAAAKTWSDPSALAQEILAQAMRGDSGGFDRLIAASVKARDDVREMAVPVPCGEHHRLTLALLEEGVVILGKLRDGVASGDTSAVAGIASTGSALEARARAVDEMGAALRSQYGVAAAP
jgi:hypothetical protein